MLNYTLSPLNFFNSLRCDTIRYTMATVESSCEWKMTAVSRPADSSRAATQQRKLNSFGYFYFPLAEVLFIPCDIYQLLSHSNSPSASWRKSNTACANKKLILLVGLFYLKWKVVKWKMNIYEIQNKIHDMSIASMSQRRAMESYHVGIISWECYENYAIDVFKCVSAITIIIENTRMVSSSIFIFILCPGYVGKHSDRKEKWSLPEIPLQQWANSFCCLWGDVVREEMGVLAN